LSIFAANVNDYNFAILNQVVSFIILVPHILTKLINGSES